MKTLKMLVQGALDCCHSLQCFVSNLVKWFYYSFIICYKTVWKTWEIRNSEKNDYLTLLWKRTTVLDSFSFSIKTKGHKSLFTLSDDSALRVIKFIFLRAFTSLFLPKMHFPFVSRSVFFVRFLGFIPFLFIPSLIPLWSFKLSRSRMIFPAQYILILRNHQMNHPTISFFNLSVLSFQHYLFMLVVWPKFSIQMFFLQCPSNSSFMTALFFIVFLYCASSASSWINKSFACFTIC